MALGDLAKDIKVDFKTWSRDRRKPVGITAWKSHMILHGACSEALEALDKAWPEWKTF